ncbi:hypothetical protein Tco_0276851 [Tanacetum coccineum]
MGVKALHYQMDGGMLEKKSFWDKVTNDVLAKEVRIYQKSQENSQKRASTDTRKEECTKAGSKAKKKSILSVASYSESELLGILSSGFAYSGLNSSTRSVRARVLNDLSAEEMKGISDIRCNQYYFRVYQRTSITINHILLNAKNLGIREDDSGKVLRSSSTENLIESLSNTLALLTQSYKSNLPQTNNQLRASSNARNKAMVQDGKVVVQDVRGRYNATNQGRPFQRNNARGNGSFLHIARECPRPKRLQDSDYFKDKMLLMQAQESGAVLDEEQSLFLAGEQVTNVDDDVDDSPENDLALNVDHIFEADECD